MKKTLLMGALALSSLFATAQEGLEGAWFVGGNISIGSSKVYEYDDYYNEFHESKEKTYGMMPMLGKFVSPSVAIGGAFGYSYTDSDSNWSKTNAIIVMPFARKYWNVSRNLYFFGQASLPFSFKNTSPKEGYTGDVNSVGINFQLSPGLDLVVNDWMTIEASILLLDAGYTGVTPEGGKTSGIWGINGNSISSTSGAATLGDVSIGVKFLF